MVKESPPYTLCDTIFEPFSHRFNDAGNHCGGKLAKGPSTPQPLAVSRRSICLLLFECSLFLTFQFCVFVNHFLSLARSFHSFNFIELWQPNMLQFARKMFSSQPASFRSSKWFIELAVGMAVFTDIFLYALIVPVMPFALQSRTQVKEENGKYCASGSPTVKI